MAQTSRKQAQSERASGRERRRSLASKPFEDESAGNEGEKGGATEAAKHNPQLAEFIASLDDTPASRDV